MASSKCVTNRNQYGFDLVLRWSKHRSTCQGITLWYKHHLWTSLAHSKSLNEIFNLEGITDEVSIDWPQKTSFQPSNRELSVLTLLNGFQDRTWKWPVLVHSSTFSPSKRTTLEHPATKPWVVWKFVKQFLFISHSFGFCAAYHHNEISCKPLFIAYSRH